MTWNSYPTPEEWELRAQIRADGYRSAMREIRDALAEENLPADKERLKEIYRQLEWRELENCAAGKVISILIAMIQGLEIQIRNLKAENQALRAENELFSRSILSLQERINAE